jgi:hypothetical protein
LSIALAGALDQFPQYGYAGAHCVSDHHADEIALVKFASKNRKVRHYP